MAREHTDRSTVAALPPIPTDTPEGIRALAIEETLRAIDENKSDYGLEIDADTRRAIAAALGVPPLFIARTVDASVLDNLVTDKQIEAYVAWRRALAAGKGAA